MFLLSRPIPLLWAQCCGSFCCCVQVAEIESLIKIFVNRDAVSVDADAVFGDVFESQSLDTLEKQNCM